MMCRSRVVLLRGCVLLATVCALLWPPASACSEKRPLAALSGTDMLAGAALVASGVYTSETVVELSLRPGHSSEILSKIVNSTFAVTDVFASSSFPAGHCFPPYITIRVTMIDGCVNLLNSWRVNSSYVVVLSWNPVGYFYEFYDGQLRRPLAESAPAALAKVRTLVCEGNETCLTAPPSLCTAARLTSNVTAPANGDGGDSTPSAVAPPDMLSEEGAKPDSIENEVNEDKRDVAADSVVASDVMTAKDSRTTLVTARRSAVAVATTASHMPSAAAPTSAVGPEALGSSAVTHGASSVAGLATLGLLAATLSAGC